VAGTVSFGISMLDRGSLIADLEDVRRALDMPDAASEVVGYSKTMFYEEKAMASLAQEYNARPGERNDEFSPVMVSLSEQNDLGEYLVIVRFLGTIIVAVFSFVMAIVLWNSGLMNSIRRYGEIGVRLALGEPKGTLYRWMLFESLITGFVGSTLGTVLGLAVAYYLQEKGFDFGSISQQSQMLLSNVLRARVTGWSYIIGYFPGVVAPLLGTLLAGVGIFQRQTSQLFKELEV